jgi:predicted heme/steroid binding protein
MDRMSEAVEQHQPLLKRLTAGSWWQGLQATVASGSWWRNLRATPTLRALLLTALGGLLIAGITTALPPSRDDPNRLAGFIKANAVPSNVAHATQTFNSARSGDCLDWPNKSPDQAVIVNCADDHRFEVAESVDMRTFPGSEYGPGAAPPSAPRIQQISQEQCQAAVRRYLGTHYDPNSRFTISMLWSGDKAWTQSGERRMLCGLQLPGADNQQIAFKGKVADLDQSKVWAAGTCLGIEPSTNQPTDAPVDCTAPHAMEVTGAVNLADKFPGPLPAESDQDGFIKDSCTKITDAYLAPVQLRTTTLTLIYSTISLPSWMAGSHQVACSIGATLGNGGWATLVGSAKGSLLINGQPPVPPPDIPDERLILPPIPLNVPPQPSQSLQTSSNGLTPGMQTQHMPNAPSPQGPAANNPSAASSQAPAANIPNAPVPAPGQPPGSPLLPPDAGQPPGPGQPPDVGQPPGLGPAPVPGAPPPPDVGQPPAPPPPPAPGG